jgi:ribosome assembly protein YihI (activator of Der GTPase)
MGSPPEPKKTREKCGKNARKMRAQKKRRGVTRGVSS